MMCSRCGTENNTESKFCIRCGSPMADVITNVNVEIIDTVSKSTNEVSYNQQDIQSQVQTGYTEGQQPAQNNQSTYYNPQINDASYSSQPKVKSNNVLISFLIYMIVFLMKPFKCFKEEEEKFYNRKNSIIFASMVAGIMTVVDLLKGVLGAIFQKKMDYSTYKMKTTIDFEAVLELDYFTLIFKNFITYAVIIAGIAFVYYVGTIIVRKKVDFFKLLVISATSLIPFVVLAFVLSPILSQIWGTLGIVATVVGAVYSLLIFINLINVSILFDNCDMKIYFNAGCMSVLGMAGYYLYLQIFVSALTDKVTDYLDYFM